MLGAWYRSPISMIIAFADGGTRLWRLTGEMDHGLGEGESLGDPSKRQSMGHGYENRESEQTKG